MKNKRYTVTFLLYVLLILTFPSELFARILPAGISKDQIWFSKDPFFAGDNITISTLVFNSSNYRMQGTMTLKDGTSTLDKRTFIVEGGGGSQVVAFPWLVRAGTHSFSALIEKGEFTFGTSSVASSTLSATETSKVKRFADYDKNKNGVGDSTEPTPPPALPVKTKSSISLPADPIKSLEQKVSDEAPAPVTSVALPVIGTIESVRVAQAGKANKNLDSIEGVIAAHQGTTSDALNIAAGGRGRAGWSMMKDGLSSGQVIRSPFDYLRLLLALIIHFFTANPYAFYAVLLLLLYKLIRVIIGLFS